MKFLLQLLVLMLLSLPGFTQSQSGANQDQNLNLRLENYLSDMEKAGLTGSVLISLPDGSIISRGCGFRNLETNQPNDAATVFDIGSLTKQFTATAILKLEMAGKLPWMTPLQSILKWYRKIKKLLLFTIYCDINQD